MPKLYYGQAIKMMLKTMPCVAVNFGAHVVFGLAVVLYYGAVLGLSLFFAERLPLVSAVIFWVGLSASLGLFYLAKHYVLYVFRAGHIAVMAEYVANGKLPDGVNQVAWGKEQVKKRFIEVSVMSAVDALLRGIVRAITNMMEGVINIIPIPGIEKVSRMASLVLRQASDYIDEAILAKVFIKKDANIFEEAKNGTILYAMAWKPILLNAAGLALFSWASFFIFMLAWSPLGWFVSKLAPDLSIWSSLSVLALAYVSKKSLGDTFALATTIIAFQKETENLQVDRIWEQKLSATSDKFRELAQKAKASMSSTKAPPPPMQDVDVALPPPVPTL